ncbi:MAG TPA: DUF4097 family beta strand repeat-containing protein [Longimicrobiaceae bacterium]|nr:DUF4097 family beta strand repeat-containing protein [Longimicrobiaceae bacterium]
MSSRIAPAALPFLLALALAPRPALGQDSDWERRCQRWNHDSDREVVCEERETRIGARGELKVDGRANGGVSVRSWEGSDILVRAQIQASAPDRDDAREIVESIRVHTSGSTIYAEGPDMGRNRSWSVSYEIFVPRRTDLEVETNNGPIAVNGVSGEMDLRAVNGPMSLRSVGGNVHARTTNGPLHVQLEGSRWSGEQLDAETTNGPVTLTIPSGYSAELETGTVHGPMSIDFPITIQGRWPRRINTTLGRGGPSIRAVTTNGPVTVRRS